MQPGETATLTTSARETITPTGVSAVVGAASVTARAFSS